MQIKSKILLVDDEPNLRRVLAQLLADSGADLTEAESAEAALEKTSNNDFDLLLVDKNLPAQNGIDLAARLMQDNKVTAALMMTGYPSVRSLIDACNADIGGYLIKPFAKLQDLLNEIQSILSRQNSTTDHFQAEPSKPRLLAQNILQWLQCEQKTWTHFTRFALDLQDPKRSFRVEQHVRKLQNQLVHVDDAADVIIGDHYNSLLEVLQQNTSSAGLYIGPGLGFDEVLSLMHRGRVAIATEAIFSEDIHKGQQA